MDQINFDDRGKFERRIIEILAGLDDATLQDYCPSYKTVSEIPNEQIERVVADLERDAQFYDRYGAYAHNTARSLDEKQDIYRIAMMAMLTELQNAGHKSKTTLTWGEFHRRLNKAIANELRWRAKKTPIEGEDGHDLG